MGTNYYIEQKPPCECCKREFEDIHIGKSSYGWRFGFRSYKEGELDDADKISTFSDWKEYLAGKRIKDEYGQDVSLTDLLDLIDSKQGGISQYQDSLKHGYKGHCISEDGYEFCDHEFS